MKEYWNNLKSAEKAKLIVFGILGVIVLVFAIRNWQSIDLHIFLTTISIPTTLLILLSMLAGYGVSKFTNIRKFRALKKEIKILKKKEEEKSETKEELAKTGFEEKPLFSK
jgi:uncharacterized integral membrane protein